MISGARISVLLFVYALYGCNGGGGGGNDNGGGGTSNVPVLAPSVAPTLSVSFAVKTLQFSWPAVTDTTHYRLFAKADSGSGFTQVGANIDANTTTFALPIAVHRHDWVNARYRVDACNSAGCTPSAAINVLSGMLATIGYIKASDTTADDRLGMAVALSADGTMLAIGAPFEDSAAEGRALGQETGGNAIDDCADALHLQTNCAINSGAVYVYTRGSAGWSQQAMIKTPTPRGGDKFGAALALNTDGSVLAIGAPEEDGVVHDTGAVHIYARAGTVWTHEDAVTATNPGFENFFGRSIALSGSGEVLVVAAPHEDSAETGVHAAAGGNQANDCTAVPPVNCANRAGAVYAFTRSSGWTPQAYIKPHNTNQYDEFGTSIALSADGRVLAVGAVLQPTGAAQEGAVYLFDGAAGWAQLQMIKAANRDHNDRFGSAVALSADGGRLAIGADSEDSDDASDPSINVGVNYDGGAVYVYTRDTGGVWQSEAYLKAAAISGGDKFGVVVSLSSDGNTLAVGAPFEDSAQTGIGGSNADDPSGNNSGGVYVYSRTGSAWAQRAYVKAPNTGMGDEFGTAIALSANGDTLAVGAPDEDSDLTGLNTGTTPDNENAAAAGAVFLY